MDDPTSIPNTAATAAPPGSSVPPPPVAGAEPLLPKVARRESQAMTACLDRYSGLVWSLARRTLGAGPEAEDAVQEVFVELWRKADRFDPAKGKEATFIAVLTRRRLIDRLRRRRARPDGQPTPLTGDTPEPAAPAASADPVAPAELADELGRVHAAMGRLKPEQQRALRLAVCDGLSHPEVAERLDMPLGTVKSHVRRGLIKLREALAEAAGGREGGAT